MWSNALSDMLQVEGNAETQKIGPVTKFEQGHKEYHQAKQMEIIWFLPLPEHKYQTESQQRRLVGYM